MAAFAPLEFFMDFDLVLLFGGIILFPVMLIALEIGRRFGLRRLAEDPEGARPGPAPWKGPCLPCSAC
jgi:hypothetical protein